MPQTDGDPAVVKVFLGAGGVTTDDGYGDFTSLAWTTEEHDAVAAAFGEFKRAVDVDFQFVSSIDDAQFVMLKSDQAPNSGLNPNTLAYWRIGGGDMTYGSSSYNVEGIGVFNSAHESWAYDSLQPGGYGYITLVHELAHGLGLKHPHSAGGGGTQIMTGVDDAGDLGSYELNQGIYTSMSYNDGWETQPGVDDATSYDRGWQSGAMALDIAMLQLLYGSVASQTGDTVYTLAGNNQAGTFFQTIWDTDGIDSIAYGGTGDAVICLQAATLEYAPDGGGVVSYVKGVRGGFTIASGAWIENVAGGSGNDWLQGSLRANTLDGGAGSDTVDYSNRGDDGNDKLLGENGSDTIVGGAGKDTLTGGNDVDQFVFDLKPATTNVDTIADFQHDIDLIVLDDAIFSAIGATLTADEFLAGPTATKAADSSDRIIYNTKTGKLYYDEDGLGGKAAVQFALLTGKPALDADDFLIV